jgi:hypothetical protein
MSKAKCASSSSSARKSSKPLSTYIKYVQKKLRGQFKDAKLTQQEKMKAIAKLWNKRKGSGCSSRSPSPA